MNSKTQKGFLINSEEHIAKGTMSKGIWNVGWDEVGCILTSPVAVLNFCHPLIRSTVSGQLMTLLANSLIIYREEPVPFKEVHDGPH